MGPPLGYPLRDNLPPPNGTEHEGVAEPIGQWGETGKNRIRTDVLQSGFVGPEPEASGIPGKKGSSEQSAPAGENADETFPRSRRSVAKRR